MKVLNIKTNWAALDVHSQYARLEISNTMTRRLKSTVIRPQMVVERKPPSFTINRNNGMQPSLNKLNLKRFIFQKNMHTLLNAINERINKPNTLDNLSAVENQPEFFVELANSQETGDSPVQNQPSGTEVVWDPGYFKIDWTPGQVQIEWEENNKPNIQISPHSVEVRVRGKKVVNIAVVEEKLSAQKGRKVNKRV